MKIKNLTNIILTVLTTLQLNCSSSHKLLEEKTVTIDDGEITLKAFDSNSNNKVDFYEIHLRIYDPISMHIKYIKKPVFKLEDDNEDGYFDVYIYNSDDKKYEFLTGNYQLREPLIQNED
ncbi:MAG: hypothetical protein AABX55_00160 [Nanoarchaeota archaeon]